MGTYLGAYGKNTIYQEPKKKLEIEIAKAECIDYYHYHGSMGEWTWKLLDINGNEYKVYTFSDYEAKLMIGKIVIIEDSDFALKGD